MNYSGLITDLSIHDYHDDRTHVSSSVIKTALTDPELFQRVYIENGEKPVFNKDALDFGSLVHTMILEPELLHDEYAFYTGATRQGKAWEQFKAFHEGKKIIISRSQKELADSLVQSFMNQKITVGQDTMTGPQMLNSCLSEESLFLEIDGLKVKVRFDSRDPKNKIIYDVKTTAYPVNTIEEARTVMYGLNYHLSASLYLDAIKQYTGEEYTFIWIFLSKADKRVNIYQLSKQTEEKGRLLYKNGIELIKNWRALGHVPLTSIREL